MAVPLRTSKMQDRSSRRRLKQGCINWSQMVRVCFRVKRINQRVGGLMPREKTERFRLWGFSTATLGLPILSIRPHIFLIILRVFSRG
ncbi:hypothetical protein BT96DRAFT_267219 [Gymnopus androsaceus JB14]|nr:hypothetical protein BT96DRAFT_267219 [Gymnopus androsaceus JB14]